MKAHFDLIITADYDSRTAEFTSAMPRACSSARLAKSSLRRPLSTMNQARMAMATTAPPIAR